MLSIVAGETNLQYWCDLNDYTHPQKKITCGYCLGSHPSHELTKTPVRNVLGDCCKSIQPGLTGNIERMCPHPSFGASEAASLAREVEICWPSNARERMPRIEGFFCKTNAVTKELLHTIKLVRIADAIDKEEHLKQLELQVKDSVDEMNVHQEAEELKTLGMFSKLMYTRSPHSRDSQTACDLPGNETFAI